MGVDFQNIKIIQAFARNVDDLPNSSRRAAERISDSLRDIVLNRVENNNFLGGKLGNQPYSTNPIKAHKLGRVEVTGKGMGRQMTINGIVINKNDWYWGEWDMKQKGITRSGVRPSGVKDSFHGGNPGRPSPVFVPGYREWRVTYNGKSGSVDLNFTGGMLNNFHVDVSRARGSNQYGSNWHFEFEVKEPFRDIGEMTDYYRNWLSVTEDELNQAIKESGADISSIVLKTR